MSRADQEEDLSTLKMRSKKRKIEDISNSEESEPQSDAMLRSVRLIKI